MALLLDSWWLDVKIGIRMLVKYPGLTLAGGAGIAVAVAISAGGFSVIQGNYLASSLPLDEGERVVSIEQWDTKAGKPERRTRQDFEAWRRPGEGLKSITELSAFRTITPNVIAPGAQPESVRVAMMSASGFGVARVKPLIGRYLAESDEREGAPAVVVIGEDAWRNRYASDPAVVGRTTIQLGTVHYTIVGVMPKGFAFPVNHAFWVALRDGPELHVFGRLATRATLESAQAELTAIGQRAAQADPKAYAHLRPQVLPYSYPFLGLHEGQDIGAVLAMQGLVTSLLVLVCLNVAILVYTRTAMRQAEIGVRTALGASRGRIVTQLFVEALVLSAVAAAVGVGIAAQSLMQITAATQHLAADLPFWLSFRLSPGAVLWAAALSILAAAIIGIVPALQATSGGLQTGMRIVGPGGGASGMRMGKIWTVLIVAQVGFAVALLPPAVAGTWTDTRNGTADVGFAAGEFLTAQLSIDAGTTETMAARQKELLRRLEAEPRVAGVTFAMRDPGDERGARIALEDASVHEVRYNRVDVQFFRTFEVPVLAGRGFGAGDVGTDFVVVNQSFAQRVFGGSALGRRFRYADEGSARRWYEVIGIVSDFPTGVSPGMRDSPGKMYHAAAAGELQPAALAVRVRGNAPASFARNLREIAGAVDPELQLRNIQTLDESLRSEQWISRLQAGIGLGITVSVLMLSSAGIYALMSFTVSQRRREIGIRLALGANWQRIVLSIFSRAFLQLGAGATLGVTMGVMLDRMSGGELMKGNSALVVPGVTIAVMAVGFAAALGPARRSLRITPTEALREQ